MRLLKTIIILMVVFISTPLLSTTVNPDYQFLEVVNHSFVDVVVKITRYTNQGGQVYEFRVKSNTRMRINNAFSPGLITLPFSVGSSHHKTSIQVGNHVNKTFLYGKQLNIAKNGQYNVKRVRFLHGKWKLQKQNSKGEWLAWYLNLSHVNPQFSGSFYYHNTGETTTIKGTMADQMMTFYFGTLPGSNKAKGQLRVTPDGRWEGHLILEYKERGVWKSSKTFLDIEANFNTKILTVK